MKFRVLNTGLVAMTSLNMSANKIVGLQSGTVASGSQEAVNGGQLFGMASSVASALGGGSVVTAAGTVTAPSYSVPGTAFNNVGAAVTYLEGRATTNATNITNLTSGISNATIGIVQQNATTRNITVGAATNGTLINVAGTAGNRVVTGLAAGAVSGTSVDAINGSQLFGTANSVATALGGGSTVAANGTVTAPSYSVGGASVNTVGAAVANLDGRVATNTGNIATNTSNIASNTTAISNLSNSVANGTAGLVQQNATTRNITVGATTDGTQVSLAGTAGNRVLAGVAAGAVNGASVEAVNGSQLFNNASSVASALGGGAAVQPNGTVGAPSFSVGGTTVNNVGAALTNVDGRVTQNAGNIATNTSNIAQNTTAIGNLANGTAGLVQQNAATRNLTVGAATDGTLASIAGTAGDRVLTGVAAGAVSAASVDAINGSQLFSNAGSVASALGGGASVQPNGTVGAPSYSVGGATVNNVGAALTNVDGRVTQNTSDIAGNTSAISSLANGTTGLVRQDATTRDITVGGTTDGTLVNVAGTAGSRVLTGVAAGAVSAASVDAINGSQLHGTAASLAAALGGGAAVLPSGTVSAPSYAVGGSTVNSVGAAIGNVDGRTTQNAVDISNLSTAIGSGTAGLVQQDAATRNIAVGAATDGTQVSIAGTAGNRLLTGVAAGAVSATSVDATNGSQLFNNAASVASALGGGAAVLPNGAVSAPSYTVGGTTVDNVGAAVTNLDGRTTTNTSNIAANAAAISGLSSGTAGLLQQNATTRDLTVGAATDGAQVSIAGTAGNRVLTGVAAGAVSAASIDAVNGSQLFGTAGSLASALGGGAAVNPDGTVSAPGYAVGGTTVNNVGAAVTNLDGRVATNTSNIAGNATAIDNLSTAINNGTAGLVQQDAATRNITVGSATDGTQVSIAGSAGNRLLTGVAAGAVSATSVDAINGSQLFNNAASVASALGGGAAVLANGAVSAPSYTVGGTTVDNVGAAVTNLDGRTTINTGNIAQNTSDIAGNTTAIDNLSTAINNGTSGLVQQAGPGADVTVAGATGGARVNFAGTGGNRVLAGVAAGAVNAGSAEAVNGSQLFGTAGSVATALGGGAAVNADGTVSAPSYVVGGTTVNTVAGAVTNLDGRVTQNTSSIAANTAAIGGLSNGTAGLVQQDAITRDITVGAATNGSLVNFAGTAGNRVLTGVAAGSVSAASVDAINGSQLHASLSSMALALGGGSAVGPNGALIPPSYTVGGTTVNNVGAAVSNLDGRVSSIGSSVTTLTTQINSNGVGMVQQAPGSSTLTVGSSTGGTAVNMSGTDGNRVISGVANGNIGQGSSEAVNGGQIYTMQQQLGQINTTTTALSTDTASNGNGNGGAAATPATVKAGTNGVAVGNAASVQASNSVAVGANSVADRPNTVSVGSSGNERVIANVADPVIDTDAVNQRTLNSAVQSANNYTDQRVNQLQSAMVDTSRKAYSGVAAVTALTMIPEVDAGKTFAIGVGASTYQGYGATAIGVSVRVNERLKIKAGAGLSSAGATTGVGASFQW